MEGEIEAALRPPVLGRAAYEATFRGWLGDADVTQDGDVGEPGAWGGAAALS